MSEVLRRRCEAALTLTRVQAGLHVIRQGESTQDSSAYRRRWPGTNKPPAYFDDFTAHPRIYEPGPNGPSSASGAYQITASTFDDFAPRLGVTTFFPADQDLLAVAIIESCNGALDDLIAGRFDAFLRKCGGRWASFPSSTAGQKTRKYDELLDAYLRFGGTMEDGSAEPEGTQPAAPIEERDMSGLPPRLEQEEPSMEQGGSWTWGDVAKVGGAVASFFNPIVGAAISALSPLLQQKIEKSLTGHTDPTTAKLVASNLNDVIGKTITRETGLEDPFQAVIAMKRDPAVVAKVEAAVDNRLDQLAPFIDKVHSLSKDEWEATEKSMNASVERANMSAIGAWVQRHVLIFGEVTVLLSLVFTGALIAYQMVTRNGEEPSGQLIILFAMLVTMAANTIRSIADWAFGSSKQSAAKDIALAEYNVTRRKA